LNLFMPNLYIYKMLKAPLEQFQIDDFKDDVKNGMLSMRELWGKHSQVLAQYTGRAHQYVVDNTPMQEVPLLPLFPWQHLIIV